MQRASISCCSTAELCSTEHRDYKAAGEWCTSAEVLASNRVASMHSQLRHQQAALPALQQAAACPQHSAWATACSSGKAGNRGGQASDQGPEGPGPDGWAPTMLQTSHAHKRLQIISAKLCKAAVQQGVTSGTMSWRWASTWHEQGARDRRSDALSGQRNVHQAAFGMQTCSVHQMCPPEATCCMSAELHATHRVASMPQSERRIVGF